MYLPADAQDRLFEQVTELSAPGSRIAAETVGAHAEERREQMRERFERIAAQFGMEDTLDVAGLMYDDPDRADVARVARRARLAGQGRHLRRRDAAARPLGAAAGGLRRRRSPRSSPPRRTDRRALWRPNRLVKRFG